MKKQSFVLLMLAAVFLFTAQASERVFATETAEIYPFDTAVADYWAETGAVGDYQKSGDAKALVLMEASTGRVLFSENENQPLPIASVTKVMSTLLIMEALDHKTLLLSDTVTVSERAASMGGSQVFLEPNEQMTVEDLLKSLVVVSANDATVALAEAVCGNEETFVQRMNSRAEELGCKNTCFKNTNGLPEEGHCSSALDVALITRELMKHKKIFDYTTIWIDSIRNGSFGLANTNKLVRYYSGATGMKTGFTGEAKYCLSGTAERDGMHLIAVVLGASTSDIRFSEAKAMLDYGFANYCILTPSLPELPAVTVKKGEAGQVSVTGEPPCVLMSKADLGDITTHVTVPDSVSAPVKKGGSAGSVTFCSEGKELTTVPLVFSEDVDKLSCFGVFVKFLNKMFAFL